MAARIDTPENRAEVLARFATARRKDLEKGHPGHPGVRTTREVADYFSWPTARAKRLLEAMHDDGDIVGWAPCPPDGCTWASQ